MYSIQITRRAEKALRSFDKPARKKIDAGIQRLQNGDFHDSKKMDGVTGAKAYRLSVGGGKGGGYRIFYYLSAKIPNTLIIPHVASREDAYDSAIRTMDLSGGLRGTVRYRSRSGA